MSRIPSVSKLFTKVKVSWRLLFGFCPDCNSDAPEIDNCYTCNGYRSPYPPSKETKAEWLVRYNMPGIRLAGGRAQAASLGALIKEGHRQKAIKNPSAPEPDAEGG